jgi:two-component system NtrC family sensor kinase
MQDKAHLYAHWTEEDLNRVFPFRIRIDSALQITHHGNALKKIVPAMSVGDSLSRYFQILTPLQSLDWKQLSNYADDLWILQEIASGLKLRGQVLCKKQTIDFLISPWLRDAKELIQYDLNLSDFAIHDPIHDFLLLKQAEKIALEDTRKINQELMRERELLRQSNQEL